MTDITIIDNNYINRNIDPDLLDCISNYTKEIDKLNIVRENSNLNNSERLTLYQLRNSKDLVFKKADKGSVVVIMDKINYLTEGYRQLNNVNHYQKIDASIYPRTVIQVTSILNKLRSDGNISEKQLEFLLPPSEPRQRYFYMLPKIHKETSC